MSHAELFQSLNKLANLIDAVGITPAVRDRAGELGGITGPIHSKLAYVEVEEPVYSQLGYKKSKWTEGGKSWRVGIPRTDLTDAEREQRDHWLEVSKVLTKIEQRTIDSAKAANALRLLVKGLQDQGATETDVAAVGEEWVMITEAASVMGCSSDVIRKELKGLTPPAGLRQSRKRTNAHEARAADIIRAFAGKPKWAPRLDALRRHLKKTPTETTINHRYAETSPTTEKHA